MKTVPARLHAGNDAVERIVAVIAFRNQSTVRVRQRRNEIRSREVIPRKRDPAERRAGKPSRRRVVTARGNPEQRRAAFQRRRSFAPVHVARERECRSRMVLKGKHLVKPYISIESFALRDKLFPTSSKGVLLFQKEHHSRTRDRILVAIYFSQQSPPPEKDHSPIRTIRFPHNHQRSIIKNISERRTAWKPDRGNRILFRCNSDTPRPRKPFDSESSNSIERCGQEFLSPLQ